MVCVQMWSCWRTRHLWRASRSRWMRLCWSTPCPPTLSSRRSSASWWCGCQSCAPSARRPRTTCATCIWAERCPATTCSLRCCMPNERECEGCAQEAPPSCAVCLNESECVRESVREVKHNQRRYTGSYWVILVSWVELERRKCSFEFGVIKFHLYSRQFGYFECLCFYILERSINVTFVNWIFFPVFKNLNIRSACRVAFNSLWPKYNTNPMAPTRFPTSHSCPANI